MPPESDFTHHHSTHYQLGPEEPLVVDGCALPDSVEDDILTREEFDSGLRALNANRALLFNAILKGGQFGVRQAARGQLSSKIGRVARKHDQYKKAKPQVKKIRGPYFCLLLEGVGLGKLWLWRRV